MTYMPQQPPADCTPDVWLDYVDDCKHKYGFDHEREGKRWPSGRQAQGG